MLLWRWRKVDGLEDILFESYRLIEFIDCTMMLTYRPGGGPVDEAGDPRENYNKLIVHTSQIMVINGTWKFNVCFSLMAWLEIYISLPLHKMT